jgi:hypothetical protein
MKDTSRSAPGADMQPMSVANMNFLIDRLYRDCAPLQFVRELTKNSLDGIVRNPDAAGVIHWDVDWNVHSMTCGQASKLCIIDTGIGMTGPEMVQFINKLSSSSHAQSDTGNFGVGAKIAAAPLNRAGMVYSSWKDGIGSQIILLRDAAGNYGLQRFGSEFWRPLSDDFKPVDKQGNPVIGDHGTSVTLMGESQDGSTMELPKGVRAPTPSMWITRYLNGRFFRFPENVVVKVREGYQHEQSYMRAVTGMGPWLSRVSRASGSVTLPSSGAVVHWWLTSPVQEDGKEVDLNDPKWISGGHVAALYQDELYEVVYQNAGIARLQSFGIVFGPQRVVLYVEPAVGSIAANTARTALIVDGEAIDWSAYAAEFRSVMPQELRDYQDEMGASTGDTDYRKAIAERLKSVRDLFRFGKYRPQKGGMFNIAPESNAGGRASQPSETSPDEVRRSGGQSRSIGDLYALFAQEVGQEAEHVDSPVDPEVKWMPAAEVGVEDRAARFVPSTNHLLINSEFRVFTEMTNRWVKRYSDVPGSEGTIAEVVREWFQQQLVETVMSALALKQGGKWSTEEVERLWDDNALTAAVLPRYHVDMSIKRVLGQRLGTLRHAA